MNSQLRQAIHRLQDLDPYEFEHLVGELWEIQGYETIVKQEKSDRGIDVIASKDATNGRKKLLIQAKRYSGSNRVGSKEVRRYATLYQQDQDVDSVAIVTTNGFTEPGERLADDLEVETYDEHDIIDIIKNSSDGTVSDEYETVKRFLNKTNRDSTRDTSNEVKFASDCPNCGSDRLTWNGRTRLVECSGCTETFKYRDGDIVSSDRGHYDSRSSDGESQISSSESADSHIEDDSTGPHNNQRQDNGSSQQEESSIFDIVRSIFSN